MESLNSAPSSYPSTLTKKVDSRNSLPDVNLLSLVQKGTSSPKDDSPKDVFEFPSEDESGSSSSTEEEFHSNPLLFSFTDDLEQLDYPYDYDHDDEEGITPVYPHQHDHDYVSKLEKFTRKHLPIQKGKRLDVISLLSTFGDQLIRNNGPENKTNTIVKANTLRGHYILLCCVFVPPSFPFYQFSLLSHEFSSLPKCKKYDIDIVIVPKTRQGCDIDAQAFNLLFSRFPGHLAVPFLDVKRCDFICQCLNFDGYCQAIFLDPKQFVYQDCLQPFVSFGAHGFPFTDQWYSYLRFELRSGLDERLLMWDIDHLLLCPKSFRLSSCSQDSQITTTVGQLRNKLVGIYLFKSGDRFTRFLNVYNRCRKDGFEFEIVLIVLPFNHDADPEISHRIVESAIHDRKFNPPNTWWLFPFRNSSCQRLYFMSQFISMSSLSDAMIIVDPHNDIVDFYGGKIIRSFGFKAYPFTREALVKRYVKKKEKLTLNSLLTSGSIDSLSRRNKFDYDGECVPVAELQGKNVLLCLDLPCHDPTFFDKVIKLYTEIKKLDSDIELINLCTMEVGYDFSTKEYKPEVKWLELPYYQGSHNFLRLHGAFIAGKGGRGDAIKGLPYFSLLAFGKDGHIHSINPLRRFRKFGLDACYPFSCEKRDLRNEVIREISMDFQFMRNYEFME